MAVVLTSTTYMCPTCSYKLSGIDPQGDYFTKDFLLMLATGEMSRGVPAGQCPSCYARAIFSLLAITDDPDEMSQHTTIQTAELDQERVPVVNDDGSIEREQAVDEKGELVFKKEVGIDGNDVVVISTPVMIPVMRELTKDERQEKLDQANQTIDQLSKDDLSVELPAPS